MDERIIIHLHFDSLAGEATVKDTIRYLINNYFNRSLIYNDNLDFFVSCSCLPFRFLNVVCIMVYTVSLLRLDYNKFYICFSKLLILLSPFKKIFVCGYVTSVT